MEEISIIEREVISANYAEQIVGLLIEYSERGNLYEESRVLADGRVFVLVCLWHRCTNRRSK